MQEKNLFPYYNKSRHQANSCKIIVLWRNSANRAHAFSFVWLFKGQLLETNQII